MRQVVSHLLGVLFALGAAFCWAVVPPLYALGLKDTSANLANVIRLFAAGVFAFFAAILWEDFWNLFPFDWGQVVILIAVTFIGVGFGDWLYFKCLESTDVSFVVGISNVYPLFVAFFAILFGTENLTLLTLLASLIIVSGVIVISTTATSNAPQLARNPSPTPEVVTKTYLTATALSILAAFTWGITIFGVAISLQYFSPFSANAIRMSAVAGLLFLIFLYPPARNTRKYPSMSSLTLLVIAGIIGPGIGGWMMLLALDLLGSTRSSAIFSVSPFFSALIAMVVLKEQPTLIRFGGILLVCLGVLLISFV